MERQHQKEEEPKTVTGNSADVAQIKLQSKEKKSPAQKKKKGPPAQRGRKPKAKKEEEAKNSVASESPDKIHEEAEPVLA